MTNRMTKEEAIKNLEHYRYCLDFQFGWFGEGDNEAIDMAIEALENEPIPCEKCIHVKSCRKVIILKNRTYKLIRYCSQGAERKKP